MLGRVFGNPRKLDRSVIRNMVRFAGWTQTVSFANLATAQAAPLFVGAWVNVASVGSYDIGNRLAFQVRGLPATLGDRCFPPLPGFTREAIPRALCACFGRQTASWPS